MDLAACEGVRHVIDETVATRGIAAREFLAPIRTNAYGVNAQKVGRFLGWSNCESVWRIGVCIFGDVLAGAELLALGVVLGAAKSEVPGPTVGADG